jgi:hypothetical protein
MFSAITNTVPPTGPPRTPRGRRTAGWEPLIKSVHHFGPFPIKIVNICQILLELSYAVFQIMKLKGAFLKIFIGNEPHAFGKCLCLTEYGVDIKPFRNLTCRSTFVDYKQH